MWRWGNLVGCSDRATGGVIWVRSFTLRQNIQSDFEAHTASQSVDAGGSFPRVIVAKAWS